LVVGSIALVSVSRSHAITATKPLGHQLFVARLVPDGNATSIQLDKTSGVVLRRLQFLGQSDARSSVSGGGIVITTSKDVSRVRSMLASVLAPGNLLFRPVLCAAPAYNPAGSTDVKNAPTPGVLPTSCPAANQLTGSNLNVSAESGIPQTNVPPWSALASYPSTRSTQDIATRAVLLAAGTDSGFASGERLLLGPAYLSGIDVSSAQPAFFPPDWVLDLTLDPAGSTAWDALTGRQFHAYVGFDLDANLVSVPLTEPNQATFASFGGKVQISGDFTRATTNQLAIDLESGPLPVALRVVGPAGR
jgi:hypothetical protein